MDRVKPRIVEAIVTAARCHGVPITPELYERCFYEVERTGPSNDEVIDAIVRGFDAVMGPN